MGDLRPSSSPRSTLITEEYRELIRQLADENSRWGYLRLKGELRKLGFEVSASTIRRVLHRHRIPPAPRRSALTWRGFLTAHASTTVAKQRVPFPPTDPIITLGSQVERRDRLGGLPHECRRAA